MEQRASSIQIRKFMKKQTISGDSATLPAPDSEPRAGGILTPTELAGALKISIRTVNRWEEMGMPVHRHGRTARFTLGLVRKWMSENKITPGGRR